MVSDQTKGVRLSDKQIEMIDVMVDYFGTDFSNVVRTCVTHRYEELVKHGLVSPVGSTIPKVKANNDSQVDLAIEIGGKKYPLIATLKNK
jgi:hypothetical protein